MLLTENAPPEKKAAQKSTAVIIAVAVHVIILLIAGLIIVMPKFKDEPEIIAKVVAPVENTELQMEKKQMAKLAENVSSSAAASPIAKMVRAQTVAKIAAPEVTVISDGPIGMGEGDFGSGFGNGNGGGFGGKGMAGVPKVMQSRCSPEERLQKLRSNGGNSKVEKAVVGGLDWLQTSQNEDGSWGGQYKGAMTGLALLAYLGHCETPDSPKYGDTVMSGLMYLVELSNKNNGLMASSGKGAYESGIATYALGEMYAMSKYGSRPIPGVRDSFERGVEIILEGQNNTGGWHYNYREGHEGDTSVTGWQFQALKAAKHTKLKFDDGIGNDRIDLAMQDCRDYFRKGQFEDGSFGYRVTETPSKPKWSLTGAGVLGLQLVGGEGSKGAISDGLRHILGQEATIGWEKNRVDAYAWYYHTQACFNEGGKTWRTWNDIYRDGTLDAQNKDGSWPNPPGSAHLPGGDDQVYMTSLFILMLEVYYRYLPATLG